MARDRLASDYSENISDVTTCSCMASSIDKCSIRGCNGMFQEPFFLHPPGSRPRDGLYINPMNSPFQANNIRHKDNPSNGTESFYLHSPHDLVYTRITHLFEDGSSGPGRTIASSRSSNERKDETMTVKVDVHINSGMLKTMGNGNPSSLISELAKDSGSEHAYEQICIGPEEQTPCTSKYIGASKKLSDSASDNSSLSHKLDRRYSRGSNTSESSNVSSEVHCYSSTASTPSLSRNSSNERMSKSPKVTEILTERKNSTTSSTRIESEKETKTANTGPSIFRPPPPPPPPPPEIDEIVVITPKIENNVKDEKNEGNNHLSRQEQKFESNVTTILVAGKSTDDEDDAATVTRTTRRSPGNSAHPSIGGSGVVSSTSPEEESRVSINNCQLVPQQVSRHMVLPFIPPQFANHTGDSESLLKPSEYLRSICKGSATSTTNNLSKARSVDNLDIHIHGDEEDKQTNEGGIERVRSESSGPPPPPLPPPLGNAITTLPLASSNTESEPAVKQSQQQQQQQQQPLATISIQDLTSVQLRRTNLKMQATKTFSAPPNRSVSMTNVSEAFFVQKTDLIAELKKTKDIPGIKKLKVQRAQVEKSQEQNLISEISKAFSISNFVDQIPEKDNAGNIIPIWKRQMLARKAAERAKKELEEQIARENEEKRQKAIPPWKRQLLAKKDSDTKSFVSNPVQSNISTITVSSTKIETPVTLKKETINDILSSTANVILVSTGSSKSIEENKSAAIQQEEKKCDLNNDSESVHIIPWRAQLRKTNSKLNILD